MGGPFHGKDAIICVNGASISGANAWNIDVATETVKVVEFGDTWKTTLAGPSEWSGGLTLYEHDDVSTLFDATIGQAAVALLVYPFKSNTDDYYSGNIVLSAFGTMGDVSSAIGKTVAFEGDSTLTQTGYS